MFVNTTQSFRDLVIDIKNRAKNHLCESFLYELLLKFIMQLYLNVNNSAQKLVLTDQDKCLFLTPHPDDESIGCGGLLSMYSSNFNVMCLTDGKNCYEHVNTRELVKTRGNEFDNAMDFLGIDKYEKLMLEDTRLIYYYSKFCSIDIQDYNYIFIPNFLDQHKDHKAVTFLLLELLKTKKYKKGLKICFYELWAPLPFFNYFINISENIQDKRNAISVYKSQNIHFDYSDFILSLNRYRGLSLNEKYIESYLMLDAKKFIKIFSKLTSADAGLL